MFFTFSSFIIRYIIIAPNTFNIISSISQLPVKNINCKNSIPKVNITIKVKNDLTLFIFFLNNNGKKNPNGINATIFPTIFIRNVLSDISLFINFIIKSVIVLKGIIFNEFLIYTLNFSLF